jgi:hypothetical protein
MPEQKIAETRMFRMNWRTTLPSRKGYSPRRRIIEKVR